MKKKIFSLLLFVLLFLVFNENILAVKTCVYKSSGAHASFVTGDKNPVVDVSISDKKSNKDKLSNYNKYKDKIKNDECPKYLYFIIGATTQEFVYVSDGEVPSRPGQKSSTKFTLDSEQTREPSAAQNNKCQYRGINDKSHGASFTTGSTNPIVKVDKADQSSSDEKIENFSDYKALISAGKCPKYLYFVKGSMMGFEYVYVYEGASYADYESVIRQKYDVKELISYELGTPIDNTPTKEPEDPSTSCADYKNKGDCTTNKKFSCMWIETDSYAYCNTDKLQYVRCGDAYNIPKEVPSIISFIVNFLKIVTPILLIILSMISLLKALAASKEDEIKKAQSGLIKRLIAAVMVFLVIQIVQFVIMKAADNHEKSKINGKTEAENLSSCLTCFLNNDCEYNLYYRTSANGEYVCTYLNSGKHFDCKTGK